MKLISEPSLTYDDVLLVPQPSSLISRKEASLATKFCEFTLQVPIINAPMDSICSKELYNALIVSGCLPCSNRFCAPAEQASDIASVTGPGKPVIATVGTNYTDLEARIDAILTKVPMQKLWLIDIANGYSKVIEKPIKYLRSIMTDCCIIAGNVCTVEGYAYLAGLGVDAVRCGLGSGALCSTRIKTGVGMGQFTAIMSIDKYRMTQGLLSNTPYIIADGGIKTSGDIVKALAAGADMVMIGRLFAGCTECPSSMKVNTPDGPKTIYRGQASRAFMDAHNISKDKAPEGEATLVACNGSVKDVISQLAQGIQSGMSYIGAKSIMELREKAVFRTVSPSTYIEGLPKK